MPGGAQLLVAREVRSEGRLRRSVELLALDSLLPQKQAASPQGLAAFQRWQDAAWRRQTLYLR